MYLFNQEVAARGIKVILDGTGGDEILGGYPGTHFNVSHHLAADRQILQSLIGLGRWLKHSTGSVKYKSYLCFQHLKQALTKGSNRISNEQIVFNNLSPYLKDQSFQQEAHQLIDNFFIRQKTLTSAELQTFEIKNLFLPYSLYANDQFGMAWSVENRSPLLDINLVKYINVPDNQKMRHGFNKYFLRKAIPENVSDKIRWRRDKEGMGTDPLVFLKKYDKKFNVIPRTMIKYFDKKILKLSNLNIVDLDHNELEFLQLKGLLDEELIKPLYLS